LQHQDMLYDEHKNGDYYYAYDDYMTVTNAIMTVNNAITP